MVDLLFIKIEILQLDRYENRTAAMQYFSIRNKSYVESHLLQNKICLKDIVRYSYLDVVIPPTFMLNQCYRGVAGNFN